MFRKIALLILLAVPFAAAKDNFRETRSAIQPFVSGSTLRIDWKVGDLRIVKGTDAHNIHIQYTIHSERESNLHDAQVQIETRGNETTIESHTPYFGNGNTSIDADIEVPDPANLDVHLKVGDLHVEGISGDKILAVKVGDIRVAIGDTPDYRLVRAKTRIGDVDWTPRRWQTDNLNYGERGWLGGKLSYNSTGKYELRAEVSIGDIDLR
jgi:hypothetical protein